MRIFLCSLKNTGKAWVQGYILVLCPQFYLLCYAHRYFLDAPNINGEMDIRAKSQYGM